MNETIKNMLYLKNNIKVFLSIYFWIFTYLTYIFLLWKQYGEVLFKVTYIILILSLLYSFVVYLLYYLIFNIIFKLKLNSIITYLLTLFPVITSIYYNNFSYMGVHFLSIIFIFLLYWLIKSKKLNKNNIIKYIIIVLIPITLLYLTVLVYSLIYEQDKLAIDKYNFQQLDKVREILKNLKREDKQFFSLKEFNVIYNSDIKPIKNCYYITNYKSEDRIPYTFWFQIESLIYRFIHFSVNYAYPKYDLPYDRICASWCYDRNKAIFEATISRPCQY